MTRGRYGVTSSTLYTNQPGRSYHRISAAHRIERKPGKGIGKSGMSSAHDEIYTVVIQSIKSAKQRIG